MLISPRIKKSSLSEESLVRQFSRSDKNSNSLALGWRYIIPIIICLNVDDDLVRLIVIHRHSAPANTYCSAERLI